MLRTQEAGIPKNAKGCGNSIELLEASGAAGQMTAQGILVVSGTFYGILCLKEGCAGALTKHVLLWWWYFWL
jgi:hypothetical protein